MVQYSTQELGELTKWQLHTRMTQDSYRTPSLSSKARPAEVCTENTTSCSMHGEWGHASSL